MPHSSSATRWSQAALFLLPLLLSLLFAVYYGRALNNEGLSNMDRELTQISILQAKKAQVWSGAFSRFGFRHPGPVHFYYLAVSDAVLSFIPNPHARARWAALFMNSLVLGLALAMLRRLFHWTGLVLMVPLLLLATYQPNVFYWIDYWNPDFIPALLLLYLACLLRFIRGEIWLGAGATLLIQILFQLHVGTPIVTGLWALLAILLAWRKGVKVSLKKIWKPLLVLSGFSLLLWWPVIYDAWLFDNYGNSGRLYEFFSQSLPGHRFFRGLRFAVMYYTNAGINYPEVGWIVLALGGVSSGFFILKGRGAYREVTLFLLVLFLAVIASYMKIHGPLKLYMVAGGYLLFPLSGLLIFSMFRKFCRRKFLRTGLTLLMIVFTVWTIVACPYPRFRKKKKMITFRAQQVVSEINPGSNKIYKLVLQDPAPVRFVTRVALEMGWQGYQVCFDSEWGYRYGDAWRCDFLKKKLGDAEFNRQIEKQVSFYYAADKSVEWKINSYPIR